VHKEYNTLEKQNLEGDKVSEQNNPDKAD